MPAKRQSPNPKTNCGQEVELSITVGLNRLQRWEQILEARRVERVMRTKRAHEKDDPNVKLRLLSEKIKLGEKRKRGESHSLGLGSRKLSKNEDYLRSRKQKRNEAEWQSTEMHARGDSIAEIVTPGIFNKRVNPELKQYFLEVAALVRDGGVADPEERASLCGNALEEAQGKVLQLSCDASCARVLERLLFSCDFAHIVLFLQQCSPIFAEIAMDPSGSHVLESALKSIGRALREGSGPDSLSFSTLEQCLNDICQSLGSRAVDIMCSRYGSHVLRCLVSLFGGILGDNDLDVTAGKKSLAGKLGGLTSKLRPTLIHSSRQAVFPSLLKYLVVEILEVSKGNIAKLRVDSAAGPVLQMILTALEGDQNALVQAITDILECEKSNSDGTILMVEPIIDLMQDRAGSHLMEVILQMAPDALYLEIFQKYFRGHLLKLSLHGSANFVVQMLISCTRHQGQVNMISEELEGSFVELIKERRSGVIAALFSACGRFSTRRREVCRALAHAINAKVASPVGLVPGLLHLEGSLTGGISVIGCVVLQAIFGFPQECSQQFFASMVAMETEEFLTVANDSGGSRALEAFFSSSAAPSKHKHRVISKLKGHFAQLAVFPTSSFIVEKSFMVADLKLKEAIVAELVLVQADLLKTRHGPYLLKRCDIAGFSKTPDKWRLNESAKQGLRHSFTEIFGSKGLTDPLESAEPGQEGEEFDGSRKSKVDRSSEKFNFRIKAPREGNSKREKKFKNKTRT